ncbi:MAG TPA: lipid carrier--UDP-N-acetylgalactosaminyltransferase [Candidatus Marinimicrobia bacterium]|nr:lipid carrier--UDP-N-acetylgalactosaminyltransferase [Candidatus Neomarinimicrobiota bacterium]HIB51541.1 lipid carrier--UDP-N-acetylgalactosaminyltransferase [Candidatus Neomarinimicrobiota bacterium]HIO40105.1 lipid carrier--UDP-N-acetylgalactosaminyltransferase [Candidatus Neomarinimicrobiota bacterium]
MMNKPNNPIKITSAQKTLTSPSYSTSFILKHFYARKVKVISDVVFAIVLLIIGLPLWFFIACVIKLDSKGPVFFKQVRLGKNNEKYTLIKFRTMIENAEIETGPVWTDKKDPRITFVGKWLRRFYLDEVPQLFNVLKGEMSIIGPRPERPYFAEQLVKKYPSYLDRLSVKPGLTGWAQINQSYDISIEDVGQKLKYDFYYIENLNFIFDLQIMIKTILVVLLGKGW